MAREKVKVTRKPTASKRQETFTKRKKGLINKVKELSILCGVQVAVLVISPSGQPNLIIGENSFLENILDAYAKTSPTEREKSKLEHLKSLNRTCQKQGHEMNMELFTAEGEAKVELYRNQIREVQAQIEEMKHKLSIWIYPQKINDIEQILAMEESLIEALHIVRLQKQQLSDYFSKRQAKHTSKDSPSADPTGGANQKLADDVSSLEKCPSEHQTMDYNHSLPEYASEDHPPPNPKGTADLHTSLTMPHQELVDANEYNIEQYLYTPYAADPYANADYFRYPQEEMTCNPWGIGSEGFPFEHNNDSTSGFPVGNYHPTTLEIPFEHDHTSFSGVPLEHDHISFSGVPFGHEHASTSGSIGEMQDLDPNFSANEVTPFDNNPLQTQVLPFHRKIN